VARDTKLIIGGGLIIGLFALLFIGIPVVAMVAIMVGMAVVAAAPKLISVHRFGAPQKASMPARTAGHHQCGFRDLSATQRNMHEPRRTCLSFDLDRWHVANRYKPRKSSCKAPYGGSISPAASRVFAGRT
jgi:hypothetical protein